MTLILFLASRVTTFWVGILVIGVKVLQRVIRLRLVVDGRHFGTWQHRREDVNLLSIQGALFWELHLELDEEVSPRHLVFETWHAEIPNHLGLAMRDHFAWHGGNLDRRAIKMIELESEAPKGLK